MTSPSQQVQPAESIGPLKIFNVEDNAADIDLFRLALNKTQVPVEFSIATDGEEALNLLKLLAPSLSPHLIILDLNLPRKNGLQTLQELKQTDLLKAIPVLVFTTSNEAAQIELCYSLGAAAYIVKPVDFHDFVSLVQKICDFWSEAEFAQKRN